MSFRIVTPFRPFVAEAKEQREVGPFDWHAAIAMMRESARRACGVEPIVITDVDTTTIRAPVFAYETTSRRLMPWVVEIALRYIESEDFDRDTILVMPDMLVFGDLARWFTIGDFDLGLIARTRPIERPLLNSVQFWPFSHREGLRTIYAAAFDETKRLPEPEIVWGGDTTVFVRLFGPVVPGVLAKTDLGVVRFLDADHVIVPYTAPLLRKPPPDRVVDFRYMRKQHMREYFDAMVPRMIETKGWFVAAGDRFMAGEILRTGGAYQKAHLDEALRHMRHWRVAVDGGAHVGTWTVPLAERFGRVVSFEPSLDTFAALMVNLSRRAIANVQPYQRALGSGPGRGAMSLDGEARAIRDGNLGARFLAPGDGVRIMPLDALQLNDLDFLKLDVEGSEVDALAGARETLLRCRPVVLFEDKGLWKRYGHDREAPHKYLGELGARRLTRVMMDEIWGWPA